MWDDLDLSEGDSMSLKETKITSGHNNTNLSLVKYAQAQQGNSSNSNGSNSIAPFVQDMISLAKQNRTQVVLMSLKPGEDIGLVSP